MARIFLSIHDVTHAEYESLKVPEIPLLANGGAVKKLILGGMEINVFRPR